MAVVRVTSYVQKDEKAACLVERIHVLPDPANPNVHHARRVQTITVNRDGQLADYTTDLGPASQYKSQEFQILGVWEHSVAELQEMADIERLKENYWQRFLAEKSAESTLIPDFLTHLEERREIAHNRSKFGPGVRKQRNGFDTRRALEWQKQRRSTPASRS